MMGQAPSPLWPRPCPALAASEGIGPHALALPPLQVPCDPKMLVSQLEPAQLAAFKLTSIEREPRRDLALAADLDIPISVLDIGRYQVPDQPQPLEEEDAELLNVRR